jgi:hypothetical protein
MWLDFINQLMEQEKSLVSSTIFKEIAIKPQAHKPLTLQIHKFTQDRNSWGLPVMECVSLENGH